MDNLQEDSNNNEVEIYISDKTVEAHIEKEYNIKQVHVLKLVGGYEDSNYLISGFQQEQLSQNIKKLNKFIVKICKSQVKKLQLQMQNKVILYLTIQNEKLKKQIGQVKFNHQYFQIVKLVPAKNGQFITNIYQTERSQILLARVFQFVEESIEFHHYDQNFYCEDLFQQIGQKTANFIKIMQKFQYTKTLQQLQAIYENAQSDFYQWSQNNLWNFQNFNKNKEDFKFIKNQSSVNSLKIIFQKYQQIKHHFKQLPKQIIHSDICKTNILLGKKYNQPNNVYPKTLIDFGDIMYSSAFFQLIVACTRQVLYKADPLRNIIALIKGYNKILKVPQNIIQIILPLIQMRISLLFISSQKKSFLQLQHKKQQNCAYLIQMRDDHKLYFDMLSKITNQQFIERLNKTKQIIDCKHINRIKIYFWYLLNQIFSFRFYIKQTIIKIHQQKVQKKNSKFNLIPNDKQIRSHSQWFANSISFLMVCKFNLVLNGLQIQSRSQ